MKGPTIGGAVLLCAWAYVGISCGGDKPNATTANVGGQGTGATAGTGASADSGQGGAGGGSANGIPVTNGYLTQGSLHGSVGAGSDGLSTSTLAADRLCATGNAAKIPVTNAGPDNTVWGASVYWFLNQDQLPDGGLGLVNPADFSSFTKVVVGISGAAGLTLRLQLANNGDTVMYCTPLPTTGTGDAGFALSSLTESCWTPGGAAFDPATFQPVYVTVAVLTDVNAAHPFDFCITRLEFLP